MKAALKRCKSTQLPSDLERPRLFQRNKDESSDENAYREGVSQIIKQRKFLFLAEDTVFMAIDFYKAYLNTGGAFSKHTITTTYMACVSLASKFNEVCPPTLEEIVQAQDNFIEGKNVIKMEARILKHFKYFLPYDRNLYTELEELLEGNEELLGQCVKTLMNNLGDPVFMKANNTDIARAIILFNDHLHPLRAEVTKIIQLLVFRLRQIHNKSNHPQQSLSKRSNPDN